MPDQIEDRVYKPMHKLTTAARVKMAKQENAIVSDAISALQIKMSQTECNIQRAKDVREVENLIAAQLYLFGKNQRNRCLNELWSSREDIVYALENQAFSGRDAVVAYFSDFDRVQQKKLAEFGVAQEEKNYGLGDMMLDLPTSPYIEVAADGQTAQALVITMSYRGEKTPEGTVYDHIRSRFGFDLIRENDGWKIWHMRQLADISLPCCLETKQARPMQGLPNENLGEKVPGYDWKTDPPAEIPDIPKAYKTFKDGQACDGTQMTKLTTINVNAVAKACDVPMGEAQLPPGMSPPPGMPPILQPDWSEPGALLKGAAYIAKQAAGFDAVELDGSGASWIFTAFASVVQPATAMIFVPPLQTYVPARPLPMAGAGTYKGIAVNLHETPDRITVEVRETGEAANQRQLAEMVSKCVLPKVEPGKEVYLSGRMPNFAAVSIALGFKEAGAKNVSIRLATDVAYTCCISQNEREIGTKRIL